MNRETEKILHWVDKTIATAIRDRNASAPKSPHHYMMCGKVKAYVDVATKQKAA